MPVDETPAFLTFPPHSTLTFSCWGPATSKNSSFLSPVLKLHRLSLSPQWWQVSLPRKLPHEDNLDILGTDGVLAGLGNTSGLRLWWTKRLRMSSWLIAVLISMHFAQRLCQRTWQKFCHHLLKASPPFHQSPGPLSPHFQTFVLRKESNIEMFPTKQKITGFLEGLWRVDWNIRGKFRLPDEKRKACSV